MREGRLAQMWREAQGSPVAEASLSAKELAVLRLVCRGLQNREIARELHISVRTVEGHLSAIFARLGVASRSQAARYAASRDWFAGDTPNE